jgi:hypothetical protein
MKTVDQWKFPKPASSEDPLLQTSEDIPAIPQIGIDEEFPEPSKAADSTQPADLSPAQTTGESKARHWAALLTGNAALRECSIGSAQEHLMQWLLHSSDGVPKDLSDFPEAFQTARFWSYIKTIENPLRFLKTVYRSLQSVDFSFFEAIDRVGRNFGWEEERLLRWKQELENIAAMLHWLPEFKRSCEYIRVSFPLGRQNPDQLREFLLQIIDEPHRFLESRDRNEFDKRFLEFKKSYIDAYFLLHEDALHVMSGLKKDELKIDAVALRNLDLLSGLQHTDKIYLNRVKLLARWIQHNQCHLPLDQILEIYPRCYCNFNPGSHRQPGASAAQINGMIQEGLEYFRTILRRCGHLIMADLKTHPIDDQNLAPITAALSDGPMIPLNAQTIKILNRIIVKNSGEFLTEIRKAAIKPAN